MNVYLTPNEPCPKCGGTAGMTIVVWDWAAEGRKEVVISTFCWPPYDPTRLPSDACCDWYGEQKRWPVESRAGKVALALRRLLRKSPPDTRVDIVSDADGNWLDYVAGDVLAAPELAEDRTP